MKSKARPVTIFGGVFLTRHRRNPHDPSHPHPLDHPNPSVGTPDLLRQLVGDSGMECRRQSSPFCGVVAPADSHLGYTLLVSRARRNPQDGPGLPPHQSKAPLTTQPAASPRKARSVEVMRRRRGQGNRWAVHRGERGDHFPIRKNNVPDGIEHGGHLPRLPIN